MLNGLSIVNLIIAVGIVVEFCGHYVRFYAKARGTGDERARDALRQVFTLVIFGITIIGLSVLTLAESRVFKKYYFRMYMLVVLCGALNGMLLLPVLLSTITDVKGFFLRRGSRKTDLPSAPLLAWTKSTCYAVCIFVYPTFMSICTYEDAAVPNQILSIQFLTTF
ncbi:hypothetical protein PR003_g19387 [Phytophthora rubi]|uniref:Uncharacterized protein n=1 Tax=Phytophthora rubi TaxID=129364 RepID=A0A6A4DXP6_9STRA|nr:hypothetical protein PR002_g18519 [Phytophthora rubi]KAE9034786.1 hypothetical protein PR001_g9593 [Phytophthora rubi]KAE9313889.1 hypothetical protein PR003_g19387 [Phytophthora rubi]